MPFRFVVLHKQQKAEMVPKQIMHSSFLHHPTSHRVLLAVRHWATNLFALPKKRIAQPSKIRNKVQFVYFIRVLSDFNNVAGTGFVPQHGAGEHIVESRKQATATTTNAENTIIFSFANQKGQWKNELRKCRRRRFEFKLRFMIPEVSWFVQRLIHKEP